MPFLNPFFDLKKNFKKKITFFLIKRLVFYLKTRGRKLFTIVSPQVSVLAASHGQGPDRTAVCLKLGNPGILMTNLLLLL